MKQGLNSNIVLLFALALVFSVGFSATWRNGETKLKELWPKIGYTPDISDDAKKNHERLMAAYALIDSVVNSYPDFETAKKHLSKKQIEIYLNDAAFLKEDYLDVGPMGCSWYCGGGPDSIFSSSALKPIHDFHYDAAGIHDFSLRTAWVEGVTGNGLGESISFRFPKASPPVTTIKIFNGYMKSEKTWKDNARIKQLRLYINEKPYALLNLQDSKSEQIFAVDALQSKSSPLILKFEITEVYKGDKYEDAAISEIEFDGTGVH